MRSLIVSLLLLMLPGHLAALTITTDSVWQGDRTLSETVRVAAGATLTIAAGSTLSFTGGGLEVLGALVTDDVQLTGTNWSGIELKNCDRRTRLRATTIAGARTGILIYGGAPQLEKLQLHDNEVGIEVRRKSTATLRACRFERNRKVGLFVKDEAQPLVEDCFFSANGRYGAYLYRSAPRGFSGNRFERNVTGLMVAYYGSDPVIEGNVFLDNETGILVDRAARPTLQGNRVSGNRTGIRLYRRSDAVVTGNLLVRNRVAVSVAYSSYPVIEENDFSANETALLLEFQSSAWERERGAAERENAVSGQGAFGRRDGGQVTETERRPRRLDGRVRATRNWWGAPGTAELERIGATGNPSFIVDGRDTPTFEEGGKDYPLDQVIFSPWREQPATGLKE